jgi:hypothetical protein
MGVRTRGLDIKAGAKQDAADKAARAEAETIVQRWNDQLALGREMLWPPTIRAARLGAATTIRKGHGLAANRGFISLLVGDVASCERSMSELYPRKMYGPDVTRLTRTNLPGPRTKRWVVRRKAVVVAAVRRGLLTLEDACSRYKLTVEEFLAWEHLVDRHGLAGLRTTRIRQYRPPTKSGIRFRRLAKPV